MFKSIKAKLIALLTLVLALSGIMLTIPSLQRELSLENARITTIPLNRQNLALSFNGTCVAKIIATTKSEKLPYFDLQLFDLETNLELLSSRSYFNPIGQLLASNSRVEKVEIVTNGIAQLNVITEGRTYLLTGPITATFGKVGISFEYPYGIKRWTKIFSIFKKLSYVDLTECQSRGDFHNIVKEFKDA